jgi:hypothetical protein
LLNYTLLFDLHILSTPFLSNRIFTSPGLRFLSQNGVCIYLSNSSPIYSWEIMIIDIVCQPWRCRMKESSENELQCWYLSIYDLCHCLTWHLFYTFSYFFLKHNRQLAWLWSTCQLFEKLLYLWPQHLECKMQMVIVM